MKLIVPPLKSQGIKTKLVPWIQELIDFKYNRWIEPFFGTGAVGFNFRPETAIIGDSNPHLIGFYRSIQEGSITPANVKAYLEREGALLRTGEEGGYAHYRLIRDRFNERFSPLDFLFLSRAGFNGMIRFSRKGKWNIPYCKKPERFRQAYVTKIVNQVESCSRIINKSWKFSVQDFRETIASAREGDVIYCDPPYIGRYAGYYNGWTEKDEADLSILLSKTPARFVLSSWHHNEHRSNGMIGKYWSGFKMITRDHFYHSGAKAENRKPIVEALIFNFETRRDGHDRGGAGKAKQPALAI